MKDYLTKILASSKHLLSLINDVLDMSRIESGKIHLEEMEVNLSDVRPRCANHRQRADVRQNGWRFSWTPWMWSDEDVYHRPDCG